uniref:Uncharacterized protein n=1 Tax=Glossina brevipalpis TaxID=37001 RepID=A0A1A9WC18_9MUSC
MLLNNENFVFFALLTWTNILSISTATILSWLKFCSSLSFFALDLSFKDENDANIPKPLPRLEDCPSCSNQESTIAKLTYASPISRSLRKRSQPYKRTPSTESLELHSLCDDGIPTLPRSAIAKGSRGKSLGATVTRCKSLLA